MPIEDIRPKKPIYEELDKAYGEAIEYCNLLEVDIQLTENRLLQAERETMEERELNRIFFARLGQAESQIKALEENKNITLLEIKNNLKSILKDSIRTD